MIRLCKLILFGAVLALNGCTDPEPPYARIDGLGAAIPYEAIGNGKLVFTREEQVMTGYIIDADTKSSWGLTAWGGTISPDGKYVVFLHARGYMGSKPSELIVYDIDNDTFSQLPEERFFGNIGWTADSKYVTYHVELSGAPKHAIIRQSLTSHEKFTITRYEQDASLNSIVSASVNDDLTFSFSKPIPGGVNSGIFTIKLDGSDLTQIVSDTSGTVRELSPCWSPNGEAIAYISQTDLPDEKKIEVIIMNKDGSGASTIATFQVTGPYSTILSSTDPSIVWSPDGTKLAFNMVEEDGIHIYVMNMDGSGLTKVTNMPGTMDGHLSWSR